MPTRTLFKSEFEFYLHVAELFRASEIAQHDVAFSQHALAVASNAVDTSDIWANIIRGYCDLGIYEDAYSCLIASPHEHL
jgi:nuclear pore complex protein Nup160